MHLSATAPNTLTGEENNTDYLVAVALPKGGIHEATGEQSVLGVDLLMERKWI